MKLPQDILLQVFHALDVRDLFRCRAVCRLFLQLIDETQSLQYKVELYAAHMIDGRSSSHQNARERLTNLRAHQEASRTSEMRFYPVVAPKELINVWPVSGGVIPYLVGSTLKLFRPPSASRHIPARQWSFDIRSILVENIAGCLADMNQGLLVLLTTSWNGHQTTAKFHVLSADSGDQPNQHPLAMYQTILYHTRIYAHAREPTLNPCFQLVGDCISCGWRDLRGKMDVCVYNWKTGLLVWNHSSIEADYATLLDEHHLLAISEDPMVLRVYRIDSTFPFTPVDSYPSPICCLSFPALAPEFRYSIHHDEATRSNRALFPDCTPPFEPNLAPTGTLLAIPYRIKSRRLRNPWAGGYSRSSNLDFLLLFPAETVLAQTRRFCGRAGAEARVVPWDEWGPAGTVTLALDGYLLGASACGSRALLLIQSPRKGEADEAEEQEEELGQDERKEDIHLFIADVHPYAAVHATTKGSSGSEGETADDGVDVASIASLVVPQKEVCDRIGQYFALGGPGRPGRYPCRVRHRKVKLEASVSDMVLNWMFTGSAILTDDTFGVLLRRSPTFEGRIWRPGFFLVES